MEGRGRVCWRGWLLVEIHMADNSPPFKASLITPEAIVLEAEVREAQIPAFDGIEMRRPVSHPLALRRLKEAGLGDDGAGVMAAAIAIATQRRPGLKMVEVMERVEGFAREVREIVAKGNAMAGAANHVLFDRH